MKIAVICPYDLDRPGGVQAHVRDTAMAFARLGHDVTVVAPRGTASGAEASTAAPSVMVHRLGATRMTGRGGTRFEISLATGPDRDALHRLMRDGGFDVVHFHTPWTPFMAAQAFLSSTAARVVTFHDTPPEGGAGALARTGLGLLSRMLPAEAVIAVSDAPRAHLRLRPGQAFAVLPPCVDLERFRTAGETANGAGPPGPVRILFVGRLEPRKGADVLLAAYRRLRAGPTPVRLRIAGGGGDATRLAQQAARLPGVEFTGPFPDADAPGIFADCDIFCAPAPYGESFGIVLAEAMASGRAVVAAANRGYRTVMSGPAKAFLAAPGDPASLHDRLSLLARDPALRARLGEWGRASSAAYDCRVVAPRILDVYAEAIAIHASRQRSARAS